MKQFIMLLYFVGISHLACAADNICFDDNNAFSTQAPTGWVADTAKAKELGLCVVYFLKGKDFDSSPAIIYPRLVSSEKEGKAAIEKLLGEDTARLKEKSNTVKVIEQKSIKNKHGLNFEIRHFRNGPPPNEFEAVAYHAGKKAILISVLSTRSEKDFDTQRAKLNEFVGVIKPLSQNELEKYKAK